MIRKSKKEPQTVAEKVSKLLAHPNDSESEDDSDNDVSRAARVVDFAEEYDIPDARSSDFRKRNVKLLSEQSERYKGKITSRKEFEEQEESEDEEEEDEEELPYEASDSEEEETGKLQAFSEKLKAAKNKENEASGDSSMEDEQEDEDENEDEDEEEDDDDEEDDSENDDDNDALDSMEIMSKTNHSAEIQKGISVQNQLRVWERLLELRINTQKVTSKVNLLPTPETLQAASESNEELQSVLKEAQERSSKLLQQLLALQAALTQQNGEMRQSVKRKYPTDDTNSEPASKRFANCLQNNFESMRSYCNEVLLKWDDRTKLLTPGAGLKRKSVQEDYDIIKKIDSALVNRQALVEKSQILKSNQQQQEEQEESNQNQRQRHIYDDSDFYHQQLRELIEYKANTSSNMSDITKQFVELQKLRQKMKKKVDTRASKGRKLRYVVHNKLINFMAPIESTDWTEASKTELFKSLFV